MYLSGFENSGNKAQVSRDLVREVGGSADIVLPRANAIPNDTCN